MDETPTITAVVKQKQIHGGSWRKDMGKLDGKIALVTGASKGIGAGVALSLATEGAAVAVNYASDRAGADRIVEKIRTAGGNAIAIQGIASPLQ
jgi:3-oxoacyl-[acyl-carrier protein] reductase